MVIFNSYVKLPEGNYTKLDLVLIEKHIYKESPRVESTSWMALPSQTWYSYGKTIVKHPKEYQYLGLEYDSQSHQSLWCLWLSYIDINQYRCYETRIIQVSERIIAQITLEIAQLVSPITLFLYWLMIENISTYCGR